MDMTIKSAREFAKISNGNSKMPGSTFAQDSFACNVGSKLANVAGSVCEKCYARRIQKIRPSVDKGWKANLEQARHWITVNPEQWSQACAIQILRMAKNSGENYHRWFDSGDLDSVDQLAAICRVAEITSTISHWLPTREIGIVARYKNAGGFIPNNLVIRISSPMVGDKPLSWPNTSTVHNKGAQVYGHECPAYKQGNNCQSCRACWDKTVSNVSYKKH